MLGLLRDVCGEISSENAQMEIHEHLQRSEALVAAIQAAGDDMDGRFEWVDGSLTRYGMLAVWQLYTSNLCMVPSNNLSNNNI